ncbi:MAG: 50S ribosomal protein L18e [Nitrososphaerales archaeon]
MKSNKILRSQAVMLERLGRKEKIGVWRDAAKYLGATTLNETFVNVTRLARADDGGSPLFVPGKVLGSGPLDKKLVVGAFSYSAAARKKIETAGGEALSIEEFVKRFPDGSGVRLVK